MNKSEIRELVKTRKKDLSFEIVLSESNKICEKFLAQDFYKNASVIYAYLAYNTEIITDEIIKRALADGKKVAVPKVFDDEAHGIGYMDFYYLSSLEDIEIGYCKIPEPVLTADSVAADDEDVLMIMPGLAFDRNHNRYGYGGGFYDRYLERRESKGCKFYKVSLAYDFQIFENLCVEEHDKKTDVIVTKDGVL